MDLYMYHVESHDGQIVYGMWDHLDDAKRWARAEKGVVRKVHYIVDYTASNKIVANYYKEEDAQ